MGMSSVAFNVFSSVLTLNYLIQLENLKVTGKKTINECTHFMLSQMIVITRYLSVRLVFFFGI